VQCHVRNIILQFFYTHTGLIESCLAKQYLKVVFNVGVYKSQA